MLSMIAFAESDAVLSYAPWSTVRSREACVLILTFQTPVTTLAENILIHKKMSEYHTGYRARSRKVLERMPLLSCSDDFVFDNQMVVDAAGSPVSLLASARSPVLQIILKTLRPLISGAA